MNCGDIEENRGVFINLRLQKEQKKRVIVLRYKMTL